MEASGWVLASRKFNKQLVSKKTHIKEVCRGEHWFSTYRLRKAVGNFMLKRDNRLKIVLLRLGPQASKPRLNT